MTRKRLWIALLAIPICLASILVVGAGKARTVNAGGVIDPTCVSSLPCIEYDNNGSGPAIRGIALASNGVSGESKVNSTSPSNARAGVIGTDVSTSGTFNSGVKGTSAKGTGVAGNSKSGSGVNGTSSGHFNGLPSLNGIGVSGVATGLGGVGILGNGPNIGIGVWGEASGAAGSGAGIGILGRSQDSYAIVAQSANFVGVDVTGGGSEGPSQPTVPALNVEQSATGGSFGSDLIDACPAGPGCDSAAAVFRADDLGNIEITGQIFTSGSCRTGCAAQRSAKEVVRFYTPRESLPTVEDFGEAQMISGHAHVRIDSTFADTMDQHANYLVFITPEGDANTLFVSQKSGNAFTVTESRGGRDSIAFQYRIVAKPYGQTAPRLQHVTIHSPRTSRGPVRQGSPSTVNPLR